MARSHHSNLFEELIATRRQDLLEALALGHDQNNYWRMVGQVQGLDDALKISQEADFKLSGDQ